jgi:hypothetical protein
VGGQMRMGVFSLVQRHGQGTSARTKPIDFIIHDKATSTTPV